MPHGKKFTPPSAGNELTLTQKARLHWTPERIKKALGEKKLLLLPQEAPELLLSMGILNRDGSMSADSTRKFLQINHMLSLLLPHFRDLAQRHSQVRVLDAGCGNSYLGFLMAWYFTHKEPHPIWIMGVDSAPKVIAQGVQRAQELGLEKAMGFSVGRIEDIDWKSLVETHHPDLLLNSSEPSKHRPHALLALHACDTATDSALALGVKWGSDLLAVAPCCQAELAREWQTFCQCEAGKHHPLTPLFQSPQVRRETAAHFTDMLRMQLLRAHGYEVTATEFVPSQHTPKNRLITAQRRGRHHTPSLEAWRAMKAHVGSPELALEKVLGLPPTGASSTEVLGS